jgi:hypothetical protein
VSCCATAPCGLVCEECRAYIATRANDTETLLKLGKEWGESYNRPIAAEEVMCDGCRSTTGRVWLGCRDCALHQCEQGKETPSCARCASYPCSRTEGFWGKDSIAKQHAELKGQ